jgi:hypothetical protein
VVKAVPKKIVCKFIHKGCELRKLGAKQMQPYVQYNLTQIVNNLFEN